MAQIKGEAMTTNSELIADHIFDAAWRWPARLPDQRDANRLHHGRKPLCAP